MYVKIIVIFLIFVLSNYLKSQNELLKVKIDVKGIASWAEDGLDGLFGEDDEN